MQVYFIIFVLISSYLILTMGILNGGTPYASSCDPSTNNGVCSSSSLCSCATLASGGNVCTQQMNCDFGACGTNDYCEKDNSTCVLDTRCPGQRICYSLVLFTPEVCPPTV